MKTLLPTSITTIEQAKVFLTDLANNCEAYHPEDRALDCISHIATAEECFQCDKLMNDIYNLEGNNSAQDMIFDPCQFLLEIDPDYKRLLIDGGEEVSITDFLRDNAAPDVEPLSDEEIAAVNNMKRGDILYFGMSSKVTRTV